MTEQDKTTVVFVHGLAKKPSPENLRMLWLNALAANSPRPDVFGPNNEGLPLADLGFESVFAYWADIFYGTDYETDFASYLESSKPDEIVEAVSRTDDFEDGAAIALGSNITSREQHLLDVLDLQMNRKFAELPSAKGVVATSYSNESYEIASWLPASVKQFLIKKARFEAYHYLFDKEYVRPGSGTGVFVRQELRKRLIANLVEATKDGGKVVICAHSMGTMIAYDVLRNLPECPQVEALVTLGSPLGITEIQDELKSAGSALIDFPSAKLNHWINIYDPLDPICGLDPVLANDFVPVDGKSIIDIKESNWGPWRHTITHYLAGTKLRKTLKHHLGLAG
jgi:hypothetical protein